MRIGTAILVVWLIIGAIAGGQRQYYNGSKTTCAKAGTVAVTIVAGPAELCRPEPEDQVPGADTQHVASPRPARLSPCIGSLYTPV